MAMKESLDIISEVLNSISPIEVKRLETRMLIASKIANTLKEKGWKKKDLMEAMGKKNASEITRWLSGTHNFTSDLLSDLSYVLGIDLLNIEENKFEPIIKVYHFHAKSEPSSIESKTPSHAEIENSFYKQRIQIKA
ncbi:hypothetical protein SDC9_87876 [bioreactor metagenome]|uniref:HTH cro/C1-type domain-containing protein n=1 Tax=bioreactor metagenome TaxID=1076179 RepID=A0A644ZK21_9ZZZZ